MPTVRKGENRSEWLERCIPVLIKEGNNKERATAICFSMWRESKKKKTKGVDIDDLKLCYKKRKRIKNI